MFIVKIIAAVAVTLLSLMIGFATIELLGNQQWIPGVLCTVVTFGGFNTAYRLAKG